MKHTMLSFGAVAAACSAGLLAGASLATSAWARGRSPYQALDTLARAMTAIEGHHVEEVEPETLIHAAVRGMADELDQHSVYLDPDEWRSMQDRNEGRWFGIGVELRPHPRGARISRVVLGGPADLAGVQAEDLLVTVDGQTLQGVDLSGVADALAGDRGDAVVVEVERGDERLALSVVRDQVIAPVVQAELLSPGQGYVRVEHFRQRTSAELAQAMTRLEEEGGQPLSALVLDLRDNPGGLLEEAVAMVDLFVGEGLVVETRGRGGEQVEVHHADADERDRDLSLAVLINGGSASASEIVAGALQDLGRATVVGTPSYGKGSVQQVYEFEDGSALKLTVARYYLASGRTFDAGEGVHPDVEITLGDDLGGAAARLLAALEGLPADQAEPLRADVALLSHTAEGIDDHPPEPEVPWTGPLAQRIERDPQLQAAWRQVNDSP